MSDVTMDEIQSQLLHSYPDGRRIQDALQDLFSGDGTIYLVVGFFTHNGYQSIRSNIKTFLERTDTNRLRLVVGPATDQFSSRIAKDLETLDRGDQVEILGYRRGLHAKLYMRDGPEPHVILTSANLTKVGFQYNVELGIEFFSKDVDHPQIVAFREWVEDLVHRSEPLRRRDLFLGVQFLNTFINWTNKGRLLPRRHIAKRIAPVVILLFVIAIAARLL